MNDNLILDEYMYPCANYVIRRLNLDMTPTELIRTIPERYSAEVSLKPGDILVWDKQGSDMYTTAYLTLQGANVVVATDIRVRIHYAVVEPDGLVSDLVSIKDEYLFTIRVRRLSDTPTPTGFISNKTMSHG